MAGKVGRPKKTVPTGSQEVTVTLPSEIVALMDAAMAVRNIKYRGAFIRQLIEANETLLPLFQSSQSATEEMRDMFRDVQAMMRVVQTTQGDLMRALDIEPAAEPEYQFADESDDESNAAPSWRNA